MVLEEVLRPDVEPDLFVIDRFNALSEAEKIRIMRENTTERLEAQLVEGRAVWRAVEPFVLREVEEGRDVVVEGVAILPELVHQLQNVEYKALFLGNQSRNHHWNIKQGAIENERDWMGKASDEFIAAFATFVVQMSAFIEKEAHKYGFRYFELDGAPFDEAMGLVAQALMADSVHKSDHPVRQ
jgi:2-phosphoglycerate kinase